MQTTANPTIHFSLSSDSGDTGESLYLPTDQTVSYIFVIPFADESFNAGSGDLQLSLSLQAIKPDNSNYEVTSEDHAIHVATHRDHKLGIVSPSPAPSNAPDKVIAGIAYSNIYCHQEGVFWQETYPEGSTPNWIYLRQAESSNNPDGHAVYTAGKPEGGLGTIEALSFYFLPYVKIGDDGMVNPADFELYPANQANPGDESIVNLADIDPIPNDLVTIGLIPV